MTRGREPRNPAQAASTGGLFDTDRPGGLHERIYRSLIHAIVSGQFAKGSKLPSEPDLAATFGVSRPVVRQALEKLRGEGLIESLRGSGNYVAGLDHLVASRLQSAMAPLLHAQRMLDDLEFRLILEPEAAFLAARRRSISDLKRMQSAMEQFVQAHEDGRITHHFDYLFHEAIALATTNSRFIDAARALEYSQEGERLLMRHLVHFQPSTRAVEVIREHQMVMDLIQQRDGEAARKAMWNHISASRLRLTQHLERIEREQAGGDVKHFGTASGA